MNLYKARVGSAYVKAVYKCFDEIQLTPKADKCNFIKEDEKEYLLILFPEAEVKEYKIVDGANGF